MLRMLRPYAHILFALYLLLGRLVLGVLGDEEGSDVRSRTGYAKGDLVPVTCLNRTIETGEHITDAHGNLQYIPFLRCNETGGSPLSFAYAQPSTQTCTLDILSDEFYHLIEYFVHSDVPLTCRVPTYPLSAEDALQMSITSDSASSSGISDTDVGKWTPFTIALQGTLQLSHLHLHTNINVLFHTTPDAPGSPSSTSKADAQTSHLIASTAYSLPDISSSITSSGTKIVRNEPLALTFNVGWIDGSVLPGMVGRPVLTIKDHSVGFSLLSFFAIAGSAGVGALGMLVYERRKSGRGIYGNGLLGGNIGPSGTANSIAGRSTGYGGYGGYGGYSGSGPGKRD